MDGFAVYFHTTSTIFILFTHTHKASVSDEHTTERRLGRRRDRGRRRVPTTMRTSMTVGGAGATTERELGELKVRLRPRRRSMGSVARRRYRATVRKDDDENDATVRTRTDEFNGLTNGLMCS